MFQAEGFLKESSRVSKLFNLAAKGYLTILLPEITKEEWRKHFCEATLLPVDEFKRRMMIMGNPKELSKSLEIISAIDSESISTAVLNSSIAKAKIQIVGYDYCNDVEGVFKKYFNCEKPFGKKEN